MFIAFFLFILLANAGPTIHPHTLVPTNISCHSTNDCLTHFGNAWCHSGYACVRQLCNIIPEFPCSHAESCDEENRVCEQRPCQTWADCDDGIFCNGQELCVNSTCIVDYRTSCFNGICSEEKKTCSIPSSLKPHQQRINDAFYTTSGARTVLEESVVVSDMISEMGEPGLEHHSDSDGLSSIAIAAILTVVALIVLVVFVMLVIAITGRL